MGDPVARMEPGDRLFDPRVRILSDEHLDTGAREKVETRLRAWLRAYIVRLLGPLLELETSQELTGIARGIAFQVVESLGVLERSKVLNDVRSLDQDARGALRKAGIRFGAYHLYLPALLKPAPRILAAQLWALQNGGLDQKGIDEIAHLAQSGRTSIPVDTEIAAGPLSRRRVPCLRRPCGPGRYPRKARGSHPPGHFLSSRPDPGEPPAGTADGDGFVATVAMTSLVGCAGEDFATILKSLGYAVERRPGPAITVPLVSPPKAIEQPVASPSADEAYHRGGDSGGGPRGCPERPPKVEAAPGNQHSRGPVVPEPVEQPVKPETPTRPASARLQDFGGATLSSLIPARAISMQSSPPTRRPSLCSSKSGVSIAAMKVGRRVRAAADPSNGAIDAPGTASAKPAARPGDADTRQGAPGRGSSSSRDRRPDQPSGASGSTGGGAASAGSTAARPRQARRSSQSPSGEALREPSRKSARTARKAARSGFAVRQAARPESPARRRKQIGCRPDARGQTAARQVAVVRTFLEVADIGRASSHPAATSASTASAARIRQSRSRSATSSRLRLNDGPWW